MRPLITAAQWNNYLGVAGSLEYLKDYADRIDNFVMRDGTTVAYASPAGARAKSTIYQNTSGCIRFCSVTCNCSADPATGHIATAQVENANPPTITVGLYGQPSSDFSVNDIYGVLTFFVPDDYYYRVNETSVTIGISAWIEWDL